MKDKIYMVCDGTVDGIFTAIYDGFELKNRLYGAAYEDNIGIMVSESYETDMFAEYIDTVTDYDKSYKTSSAIRKKIGDTAYRMVLEALSHYDSDRATVVFGFLVRGFRMGKAVTDMLGDRYVIDTMELSRKSSNEAARFIEFTRFKDMGGTLYGVIEPKCDVIPLIGEHFDERYPNENWIIYDRLRKKAAVHRRFEQWLIVSGNELDGEYLEKEYERHDEYEQLWKAFYDALYIRERKNEKCQNNLLPKWYRRHMTEFKPQAASDRTCGSEKAIN